MIPYLLMPSYYHFLLLFTILTFASSSSSPQPLPTKNLTLPGSTHFKNTSIILTQELTTWKSNSPVDRQSFHVLFLPASSNSTISFSTHFTFTVIPPSPPCLAGDGITFLIVSNPNFLPHVDGSLGLPESNASKFDTSMISMASIDLMLEGIDLKSGKTITVWIEYRDPEKIIRVWVAYTDSSKPEYPVLEVPIDLSETLKEFINVGFSASNKRRLSIHSIQKSQIHTFESLTPDTQMETISSRNSSICYPDDPCIEEDDMCLRNDRRKEFDLLSEVSKLELAI